MQQIFIEYLLCARPRCWEYSTESDRNSCFHGTYVLVEEIDNSKNYDRKREREKKRKEGRKKERKNERKETIGHTHPIFPSLLN